MESPALQFRSLWSHPLTARPRGLCLAREKGQLLAWDESHWLFLFDAHGTRQAQVKAAGDLTCACVCDDGSAAIGVGAKGEVWWLDPDLTPRWQRRLEFPGLAVAVDPFGQYAAVSDTKGWLGVYNRLGDVVFLVNSPRPLHHLDFAPAVPRLFVAADYGLVAALDLTGRWLWRDGLVAHVGGAATRGDGARLLLACFSEGVLSYRGDGQKQQRLAVADACTRIASSFDGQWLLTSGKHHRLHLLDAAGQTLATHTLAKSSTGVALSALGERAYVADSGGEVRAFQLQ